MTGDFVLMSTFRDLRKRTPSSDGTLKGVLGLCAYLFIQVWCYYSSQRVVLSRRLPGTPRQLPSGGLCHGPWRLPVTTLLCHRVQVLVRGPLWCRYKSRCGNYVRVEGCVCPFWVETGVVCVGTGGWTVVSST